MRYAILADIHSNLAALRAVLADAADRDIDDLVYDLYGLTAAERRLVEDAVRR